MGGDFAFIDSLDPALRALVYDYDVTAVMSALKLCEATPLSFDGQQLRKVLEASRVAAEKKRHKKLAEEKMNLFGTTANATRS